MARQIKRFGPIVLLIAALAALILVPFARSDPPVNLPPVASEHAQLAVSLRDSIGFGPQDMLPAISTDQQHQQMIMTGLLFAMNADVELQPLIEARREAEKQLVHALTWDVPEYQLQAAYVQVQQSKQAIKQSMAQLVPQLQVIMDDVDLPLWAILNQNMNLDPELRTIALGEDQRIAVRQAMRARDAVLKNAMNWHNKAKQDAAREQYEAALQEILDDAQLEEVAANRELLEERMLEMLTAEMAVFPAE